jgi:hypothetical protein
MCQLALEVTQNNTTLSASKPLSDTYGPTASIYRTWTSSRFN